MEDEGRLKTVTPAEDREAERAGSRGDRPAGDALTGSSLEVQRQATLEPVEDPLY